MRIGLQRRQFVVLSLALVFAACIILGSFTTGISQHLLIIAPLLIFLKIVDRRHDQKFKNKSLEKKNYNPNVTVKVQGHLAKKNSITNS